MSTSPSHPSSTIHDGCLFSTLYGILKTRLLQDACAGTSVRSERNHWIDPGCPARREVACQQRHAQEQEGDHDERNRIGCTDPVQQFSGQAGHSEGGDQTGEQADDRYGQSLPKNEFEDVASLRSDGDANAELTRALAD